MEQLSETGRSIFSLAQNEISWANLPKMDWTTLAEITLVAVAIILLSDGIPVGLSSTIVGSCGIGYCSAAMVILAKNWMKSLPVAPPVEKIAHPPLSAKSLLLTVDDLSSVRRELAASEEENGSPPPEVETYSLSQKPSPVSLRVAPHAPGPDARFFGPIHCNNLICFQRIRPDRPTLESREQLRAQHVSLLGLDKLSEDMLTKPFKSLAAAEASGYIDARPSHDVERDFPKIEKSLNSSNDFFGEDNSDPESQKSRTNNLIPPLLRILRLGSPDQIKKVTQLIDRTIVRGIYKTNIRQFKNGTHSSLIEMFIHIPDDTIEEYNGILDREDEDKVRISDAQRKIELEAKINPLEEKREKLIGLLENPDEADDLLRGYRAFLVEIEIKEFIKQEVVKLKEERNAFQTILDNAEKILPWAAFSETEMALKAEHFYVFLEGTSGPGRVLGQDIKFAYVLREHVELLTRWFSEVGIDVTVVQDKLKRIDSTRSIRLANAAEGVDVDELLRRKAAKSVGESNGGSKLMNRLKSLRRHLPNGFGGTNGEQ